jgi:plastocyanin
LGCDEVDNRYTQLAEFSRDAEVEVRRVSQDGELRPAPADGFNQPAELFINPGDVVNYFNQSHNREALASNDRFDPGVAEAGAGAAEELGVRMAAPQFVNEERGVAIA